MAERIDWDLVKKRSVNAALGKKRPFEWLKDTFQGATNFGAPIVGGSARRMRHDVLPVVGTGIKKSYSTLNPFGPDMRQRRFWAGATLGGLETLTLAVLTASSPIIPRYFMNIANMAAHQSLLYTRFANVNPIRPEQGAFVRGLAAGNITVFTGIVGNEIYRVTIGRPAEPARPAPVPTTPPSKPEPKPPVPNTEIKPRF